MVKRERSRSYPGTNLEESVANIHKIRKNLGSGNIDREQIAIALGYKKYMGNVGTKISAIVQFGLLNKVKGGYILSDLSEKITHPKGNAEYESAITEAFYKPDLYSELIDKYKEDGRIPKQLENILYRDHKITSSASSDAASIFIDSAIFSKILDSEYNFIDFNESSDIPEVEDDNVVFVEDGTKYREEKSREIVNMVPVHLNERNEQRTYEDIRSQSFNFALTNGNFAQLKVPDQLNQKDIKIIRKQIELLELQIEEE